MIEWGVLQIVLTVVVSAIMIQYWLISILDVIRNVKSELKSINTKLYYIRDDINTIKNKKEEK